MRQTVAQAARGKAGRGTASKLGISHLTSGVEVVSFMVLGCCFTSVQVAGGSDAAVAACSMETIWARSSVSLAGVVDCCRVDVSLTAGVEGVCASPAGGSIYNVCLQCCRLSVVSHYDVNVGSE